MTRLAVVLAVTVTALTAGSTLAHAQERHRHAVRVAVAPPLTIQKRSWLDSGNAIPVGTQNAYLSSSTTLNQQVYTSFEPGRFGQSTLPGQFDLAFTKYNPRGPDYGGIFDEDYLP